mmetsp:Transcript_1879/g.11291  ORF Transcript_1879/g.11291 Transcript_1879/m.11291 type:complete len:228 (-) Transcript_1879:2737-3420(-)
MRRVRRDVRLRIPNDPWRVPIRIGRDRIPRIAPTRRALGSPVTRVRLRPTSRPRSCGFPSRETPRARLRKAQERALWRTRRACFACSRSGASPCTTRMEWRERDDNDGERQRVHATSAAMDLGQDGRWTRDDENQEQRPNLDDVNPSSSVGRFYSRPDRVPTQACGDGPATLRPVWKPSLYQILGNASFHPMTGPLAFDRPGQTEPSHHLLSPQSWNGSTPDLQCQT